MRRHIVLYLSINAGLLVAQSAAQKPEIEVAAIHRNETGGRSGFGVEPGSGRPTAHNMTLRGLIGWAYDVENYQISGGPKWIDSIAFDITATLVHNVPMTGDPRQRDEYRELMRPFLTDRFRLEFHRTTKELPVYALVVGKEGSKLKEMPNTADPREWRMGGGAGLMTGHVIPVSILVEALKSVTGRPISDETGLKGRYDFSLRWNPADNALSPDDSGNSESSLFTAIQEQLGLRLESRKGTVEVIIVDRAEMPTEN